MCWLPVRPLYQRYFGLTSSDLADLYLIRPPPGAKHGAIDPKHIVIAGDSAGGNLTLALLTLIRDLDLPMPAGATLISPWVDLTHSFPSVMDNTRTVSSQT
jgi:alpha/beta hydrolase fold